MTFIFPDLFVIELYMLSLRSNITVALSTAL